MLSYPVKVVSSSRGSHHPLVAETSATPTAPESPGEHSRHPPLGSPCKIVQIIGKGQHGITAEYVGPLIGNRAGAYRLAHRSILVQHVKNGQPQFAILLFE